MTYQEFLASKAVSLPPQGIEPSRDSHPMLFPFQRDIVRWALRRGRACVFADCGLGKTFIQLEWAAQIPGRVLILAPLAVAEQTVAEGRKIDVCVRYCRSQDQADEDLSSITITNYEMLEHFDPSKFTGVVLDESSILKNYDGATRNAIIGAFRNTAYRLACTATPAPNDHMELGNHAEFVGAMTRTEMLSMFFVHDGGETSKWRLKGHAQTEFWKWVCSWAVMLRKPSDLGYDDGDFILPPLIINQVTVEHAAFEDTLFALEAQTLQERIKARRDSIDDRVNKCADIVSKSAGQWLIWCNLNSEADALEMAIEDAVQVAGSESPESKTEKLIAFAVGKIRVLVTKPSIAGLGMNFQNCNKVAFVGLSDSWEEYYQAVRRCWRFGQVNPVDVYVITSSAEGAVVSNINRKEQDAALMAGEMVKHMHGINEESLRGVVHMQDEYFERTIEGRGWAMHRGDCVDVLKMQPSNTFDFSVFSPPFASLYTYSASERDMGNSRTYEEFVAHFGFLISELFRTLKPGRNLSFHCMNLPTSKSHHGYIGIRDFRGDLIRMFEAGGFIFHSEVCIWKDPVTAMQRTKALGLLWKQLKKDSCMSRQGIADYLITMRKPGENEHAVSHTNESFPVERWQQWASPVWMDIDPSDTLQYRSAREHNDERHICPLQLEVIHRALVLWSNPGDLVLSPFAGIGSEGFQSLKDGRRFIGIELKESYYRQAVENLKQAERERHEGLLFTDEAVNA